MTARRKPSVISIAVAITLVIAFILSIAVHHWLIALFEACLIMSCLESWASDRLIDAFREQNRLLREENLRMSQSIFYARKGRP